MRQMFEQRLEQGERLIDDAREHVPEIARGPSLDAVLIAATQKTEHYCIAAWGTAKSLGQATGQSGNRSRKGSGSGRRVNSEFFD